MCFRIGCRRGLSVSDLKLFRIYNGLVNALVSQPALLEKSIQTQFEHNLESLLGVRFLASEYVTSNGGRMDSLGLDENGNPVIIEYKRDRSENIINQGLFYLDWLMDHKADFELLVRDRYGLKEARHIEWSAPRLICIASDFTKYDIHAVNQMGRNIELVRYKRFADDLLLLELLTAVSVQPLPLKEGARPKTVSRILEESAPALRGLYEMLDRFLLGLGDDIVCKAQLHYFAYRRLKNFACVEIKPSLNTLKLFLKIDPATIRLEKGFSRNVKNIGHYGTGDLELLLTSYEDLEKAKPLIFTSYEAS